METDNNLKTREESETETPLLQEAEDDTEHVTDELAETSLHCCFDESRDVNTDDEDCTDGLQNLKADFTLESGFGFKKETLECRDLTFSKAKTPKHQNPTMSVADATSCCKQASKQKKLSKQNSEPETDILVANDPEWKVIDRPDVSDALVYQSAASRRVRKNRLVLKAVRVV